MKHLGGTVSNRRGPLQHPTWLLAPPSLLPLRGWLDVAGVQLREGSGLLCLGMPPGVPRLMLLAAVAQDHPGEVVAVRLNGCQDAPDVIRAIGFGLHLPRPGHTPALGAELASRHDLLLVLEGAEAPETLQVLNVLTGLAPHVRVLLGGEVEDPSIPRLHEAGAAEFLPPPPRPEDHPELTPTLQALALVPSGTSRFGLPAFPEWAGLPMGPQIACLLPEIREHVLAGEPPDARTAAKRLLPCAEPLLSLATGGSLNRLPTHQDLLLCRFLARHLDWSADSCAVAASAARLVCATGQLNTGRSILQEVRDRHGDADARALALLSWAEGDLFLAAGLYAESIEPHEDALEALEQEPALQLILLRRLADSLAVQGRTEAADGRYRAARSMARSEEDNLALGAILRGTADLAVASAEVLSADALYDQAKNLLDSHPRARGEQANLALGRASLALSRGQFAQAESSLLEAKTHAEESPLLVASMQQREGELNLRRGALASAERLLLQAASKFLRTGQPAAAARTQRTLGDVAAIGGHYLAASDFYVRSIADSARSGDLASALKTLGHLVALEKRGSDVDRVQSLEKMQEDLLHLAGPALEETTGV